MYFDEGRHPGRPHFHVEYGEAEASYEITSQERLVGAVPRRVERLVQRWAGEHQRQLLENWDLGRRGRPLKSIEPLK
jgi:hypothetical protein